MVQLVECRYESGVVGDVQLNDCRGKCLSDSTPRTRDDVKVINISDVMNLQGKEANVWGKSNSAVWARGDAALTFLLKIAGGTQLTIFVEE